MYKVFEEGVCLLTICLITVLLNLLQARLHIRQGYIYFGVDAVTLLGVVEPEGDSLNSQP